MTEKKRSVSKKRTGIMDAAVRAFQEEGFDNTSMDRIAELADSSKRTVYNHFPSKDDLFQAVVDRFMDEMLALKQVAYDPDQPLEAQLGEFAAAKTAFAQNPDWLGMMKVALGVFITNPAFAQQAMGRATAGEDSLVTWLKAATKDGRMKATDAAGAAEVFWAMVSGAFFWPAVIYGSGDPVKTNLLKDELIGTFLARYGA